MNKSQTRAYTAISNAIARCHNENNPAYHRYGGRGIVVCKEWRESPASFVDYMPEQPIGGTLERIDNNKGYEPGNVRWATMKEQSLNRRTTILIEYEGERLCLKDLAAKVGLPYETVQYRYKSGYPLHKIVSKDKFFNNGK